MKELDFDTVCNCGILQEINRLVLHPNGLELRFSNEGGEMTARVLLFEDDESPRFSNEYYEVLRKADLFRARLFDLDGIIERMEREDSEERIDVLDIKELI